MSHNHNEEMEICSVKFVKVNANTRTPVAFKKKRSPTSWVVIFVMVLL